ncbi:uncharacterized protein BO96DRAFT_218298 [Aspergillus niger CBS 101883]|uniref:uncharacterized protein n=1 Tax=Aspergillus lacticoffeatus (strain CBS 101883) TaxID=1450533 RepID=UPI000D7F5AD6|nr:uncharacterized protein BO96DRAFT_218298 [Aspergillus niger CBS 101883]PYH50787.1 hypothetical protein BO96DRAFT_218298 [Aspergillus niger CBS 101883]
MKCVCFFMCLPMFYFPFVNHLSIIWLSKSSPVCFLIIMRRRILECFFVECRGYNQDRILHDRMGFLLRNTQYN